MKRRFKMTRTMMVIKDLKKMSRVSKIRIFLGKTIRFLASLTQTVKIFKMVLRKKKTKLTTLTNLF